MVLAYDFPTKLISWLIVLPYITLITILFFRRMAKADRDFPSQRLFHRSMAIFFLMYIANRIFFILSDFERDANGQTEYHYQLVFIGYILVSIAFLNMLYFGEKFIVKKTKFILCYITTAALIVEVVLLFIPELFGIGRLVNYGLSYFLMMLVLILFIKMIVQSIGVIRRDFTLTLIGFLIIALGSILEMDALLSSGIIPPWLTPILFATGASIVAYGLRSKI